MPNYTQKVIITLNKEGIQSQDTLIRYLSLLLNREMDVEERQKLIQDEYRIAMTDDIVEDVKIMCSYSDAIENAGRIEGRAEGLEAGIEKGEAKLARLMQKLFSLKRYEDAEKASVDVAFRTQLYNEFQMA